MDLAIQLPKSYYKANLKLIEQDLLNYQLMKLKIEEIINELETSEFEPGPRARVYSDLYNTGYRSGRQQGLTARGGPRQVIDSTYQQAMRDISLGERYARAKKLYEVLGITEMIRAGDMIIKYNLKF